MIVVWHTGHIHDDNDSNYDGDDEDTDDESAFVMIMNMMIVMIIVMMLFLLITISCLTHRPHAWPQCPPSSPWVRAPRLYTSVQRRGRWGDKDETRNKLLILL